MLDKNKIFVINMVESHQRLLKMKELFSNLGVEFEIVVPKKMKNNVVSCFYSHLECIRRGINYENKCFICEDDLLIKKYFCDDIKKIEKKIEKIDFDILYFHGRRYPNTMEDDIRKVTSVGSGSHFYYVNNCLKYFSFLNNNRQYIETNKIPFDKILFKISNEINVLQTQKSYCYQEAGFSFINGNYKGTRISTFKEKDESFI